jgi:hypothetical protein
MVFSTSTCPAGDNNFDPPTCVTRVKQFLSSTLAEVLIAVAIVGPQYSRIYGVPPDTFSSHLGRSTPLKSSQMVNSNNPGIINARSQPD